MLSIIGYSLIGTSIIMSGYPAFESVFLKKRYAARKAKENLHQAFVNGEVYKKKGDIKIYPNILKFEQNRECMTFVFSIPKGLSPDKVEKALYVFKQHFSRYINLDVDEKRGILKVYKEGLPSKHKYNYVTIADKLKGLKVPIVGGINLEGKMFVFDMVENPHIIIAGETGSGKSSHIRALLTTLIKSRSPKELRLILGDLKRSEFHLFKRIEHVEGVYHSAEDLEPALKKIKREMTKRGDLLDKEEVTSIDKLKKPPPYIVVCIDEVRLLKSEKDIMNILEEISSIGRSLGIFLILSMQRPDSKLLEGALKVNCTVRMGFKTADLTNSNIIGTPGSEDIRTPGRMIMRVNSDLREIQSPILEEEKAKELLMPYKTKEEEKPVEATKEVAEDDYSKVVALFNEEAR